MKIIENIEQGSPEWLQLRCGVVTASNFTAVLSKGTTRKTYLMKLVAERLTGEVPESFSNKAMQWGTDHEPMARANYELETGACVNEIAFIAVDDWVGVSPDGLIGDDGLIEIKCPNTTTHIETFLSNKMPTKHKPQVQGQLWASGRQWCDFVSYDPRLPGKELFISRVVRDDDYIAELEAGINKFVDEMKTIIEKINGKQAA